MFSEYEIDTRERIARYLTQRFPQGVPTYLSLREVSQLRCDEKENTSHYAMNVEIPSISKQESYTKRPPKISMLTRGPTDKLQVSSPKAPPKAYPDPRVSTSRRMSSESEDDDEIEENIYNNNFTRVILDLKSKFSPSSENPKSPDYDDMKGSDYEPGDNEDTVERQHSFDFANDDKEQALKEELGEVCTNCLVAFICLYTNLKIVYEYIPFYNSYCICLRSFFKTRRVVLHFGTLRDRRYFRPLTKRLCLPKLFICW